MYGNPHQMQEPEPFALCLLPPLWQIVSDYFDLAERWYYAKVKTFQIKHRGADLATLETIIENNHLHIFLGSWCCQATHQSRKCQPGEYDIGLMVRHDRAEMLEHARKYHKKTVLKYFRHGGDARLRYPVQRGSLEILRWEVRRGLQTRNAKTISALAQYGHTKVLQQLRADGWPWDVEVYTYAIWESRLDTIKWLETTDLDISKINVCKHIRTVATLKYFIETAPDKVPLDKMLRYAVYGHFNLIVEYLIENTRVMDLVSKSEVVEWACNNSLIILRYLLERGFPRPSTPVPPAVRYWLRANYDGY